MKTSEETSNQIRVHISKIVGDLLSLILTGLIAIIAKKLVLPVENEDTEIKSMYSCFVLLLIFVAFMLFSKIVVYILKWLYDAAFNRRRRRSVILLSKDNYYGLVVPTIRQGVDHAFLCKKTMMHLFENGSAESLLKAISEYADTLYYFDQADKMLTELLPTGDIGYSERRKRIDAAFVKELGSQHILSSISIVLLCLLNLQYFNNEKINSIKIENDDSVMIDNLNSSKIIQRLLDELTKKNKLLRQDFQQLIDGLSTLSIYSKAKE